MPDNAKRHLVGIKEQFQEMGGKVFAEEMETNDIQEVQQDGDGIGDDVDDVDEGLQLVFINDS